MQTESLRPVSARQPIHSDWQDGDPSTVERQPTTGCSAVEVKILRLLAEHPDLTLSAVLLELERYDEAVIQAALWWMHLQGKLELRISEVRRSTRREFSDEMEVMQWQPR